MTILADIPLQRQLDIERDAVRAGVDNYYESAESTIARGEGGALRAAQRLILHWQPAMTRAVQAEVRSIEKGEPGVGRAIYGPVVAMIEPRVMSLVTINQVLSLLMLEADGVQWTRMAYHVGRDAVAQIEYKRLKAEEGHIYQFIHRKFKFHNPKLIIRWSRKELEEPLWDRRLCINLGSMLVWNLIGVASAAGYSGPFVRAFAHERRRQGKQTIAYLRMTEETRKIIDDGHVAREALRPVYPPMVVEPTAWAPANEGGYLRIRTPLMNRPNKEQRAAMDAGDMSRVYASLNAVNRTQWKVNPDVLEWVQKAWSDGGNVAGLPTVEDTEIPPRPSNYSTNVEAKRRYKAEANAVCRDNRMMTSERTRFLSILGEAESYADEDRIWFPHRMDFRGRLYPIPPALHHQGNDTCRGLLMFAQSRAVAANAVWWLKYHAANMFGHDKLPAEDRVKWVDNNFSHLMDVAKDPLDHPLFVDADEPWQFLAACIELWRIDDGERQTRLPVQVDGSCNGLQHYAALLRDDQGAAVVNLIPGEKPRDIYTIVAERTAGIVANHASDGDAIAVKLDGHITRDVVKRTVMTKVYGVTAVGARQQVSDALRDEGLGGPELYDMSYFASRAVLLAIGDICRGASAAMDWLRAAAQAITDKGHVVGWTTPLGLPVVQPYRNTRRVRVRTLAQWVNICVDDERLPPHTRRQRDGVAPNFIHSIDATHMMMTAAECAKRHIDFAAVHDSYWTHAGDMDEMSAILREQFVAMHRQPILADLRQHWMSKYQVDLPELPAHGHLDINEVMHSRYFFA